MLYLDDYPPEMVGILCRDVMVLALLYWLGWVCCQQTRVLASGREQLYILIV